eukprot:TCALIF_10486-PA protein Name:"Protein of unknown function" AED:0.38 eAED:0.38 QI:0/0/0/0.33/0/0/3/0/116
MLKRSALSVEFVENFKEVYPCMGILLLSHNRNRHQTSLAMFVKWSPLFFATTLMLLVLNPSETEAKRPASRKRYDMFWYGPVSNPDDCLAHDRSRDLVLKRKMFQDPSDLCTQFYL